MDSSQDVTVVCLLRVSRDKLPRHLPLSDVPEVLSDSVSGTFGRALIRDRYYVVKDYGAVKTAVNCLAEPFDDVVREGTAGGQVIYLFGGRHARDAN